MNKALLLSVVLAVPAAKSLGQTTLRPEAAPRWSLVEDLRIGGDDDGPKSFSDIRAVSATRAGTIFILDFKTQEIRVFDSKGVFVRQAARQGNGPGEIVNANGMAVGPDDVVWVNDPHNGRFSLFRSNGQFARQIQIPITSYGFMWMGAIDESGRALDLPITIASSKVDPQTGRPISSSGIRIVRPDGKADTIAYPTCSIPGSTPPTTAFFRYEKAGGGGSMMSSVPFVPRQQIVLTSKGTVWCTPSSEYRLSTGPAAGPLKEVVRLALPPLPLPAEERKKAIDRIDSIVKNYGPMVIGDPSSIPKTKPLIFALFADDQGRAWVRRTETPEATPSFDVFEPSGRLAATARVTGKVGIQTWITGNSLYTVLKNDDDVPVVVRYKIVR